MRGTTESDRYWTTAYVGEAAPRRHDDTVLVVVGGGTRSPSGGATTDSASSTRATSTTSTIRTSASPGSFYGRVAMNMTMLRVWMSRCPA